MSVCLSRHFMEMMNINYGCQKQKNHGHGARAILQINKFDVDTFAIMAKEAVSLVSEVCTLALQAATRQHTTERS